MKSSRTKVLDNCVRDLLVKELQLRGFSYDRSTRTFRRKVGECTQLINIQIGIKSLVEKFTVNLAVYHPRCDVSTEGGVALEYPEASHCRERTRLGELRDTPITLLFGRFIKPTRSWLSYVLTQAGDKWWRFSIYEPEVRASLPVLKLLQKKGFNWLDQSSERVSRGAG